MVRIQITRRIIELREKLGMSQSEFARRVGTSRSTVHGWDSGRNKPDEDFLVTVAKTLNTSISYLYGETDDPRPAPDWVSGQGPQTELQARVAQARDELARVMRLLEGEPLSSATVVPLRPTKPQEPSPQESLQEPLLQVARSARPLRGRKGDKKG